MSQTTKKKRAEWDKAHMARVGLVMKHAEKDRWSAEAKKREMPLGTMIKVAVEEYFLK